MCVPARVCVCFNLLTVLVLQCWTENFLITSVRVEVWLKQPNIMTFYRQAVCYFVAVVLKEGGRVRIDISQWYFHQKLI